MFNEWLNDVKAFFKNSWSIFIARMEVLSGILVGVLGAIDWNSITALDFSNGLRNWNTAIVAGLLVLKGVVSELGRRSGTVETKDNTLVPASVVDKATIKIKQ